MVKENDIIKLDENYSKIADYCNKNNLYIDEISPVDGERQFIIKKVEINIEKEKLVSKIYFLKKELVKIKEDVEQVELFGMERTDYQTKKARCREIILELRELENQI